MNLNEAGKGYTNMTNIAMLTKCGLFAMILTIFVHINGGMAQQEKSSEISGIGEAYEFRGVTKYLSAPSKILLPDKHFLGSQIVDAYDFTNIEENECTIDGRVIGLKKDKVKWWQAPVYRMLPEELEESPAGNQGKKAKPDIIIIPNSVTSLDCGGSQAIATRRFVISAEIAKYMNRGTALE